MTVEGRDTAEPFDPKFDSRTFTAEEALVLAEEWAKQRADPTSYRQGKHVYPGKVMPGHLLALAALAEQLAEENRRLRAALKR